ncbi:hypothetical protein RUM43_002340 [Polyplax serrata]|uniref:Laminin N-terminal domain-containing protein n=1 Tax=Polyplax serrata TaxID=468196 RepID=A0AAN8P256_POLSC
MFIACRVTALSLSKVPVGYQALAKLNFFSSVCDVCDPTRPDKMHPASFAIDGAETWWQSPPLSRSMKLNEVNLTIDFGQVTIRQTWTFIQRQQSRHFSVS